MANSANPDQKPTDLDLHCLQRQGISGFSRTRVKEYLEIILEYYFLFLHKNTTLWVLIRSSSLEKIPRIIIKYSSLSDGYQVLSGGLTDRQMEVITIFLNFVP